MPTAIRLGSCLARKAVAGDHTLVVEAHQRDHVADVGLALDPAGTEARPAGEDRVVVDPPLVEEGRPDLLGKAEVGDVIAVKVADLAPAYLERELSTPAWPGVALLARR